MVQKDVIALSLKVLEAYTRDVMGGVVRIDNDSMKALDASTGDVIEIIGIQKRTVAKCLPLYPSDEGKGIIRIDELVRNNAGIAIGDTIAVRKIKAVEAEKVIVMPLETTPPIDERFFADALKSIPITKGDNVMTRYFGGTLTFQVVGVAPAGVLVVTEKTQFHMVANAMEPLTDKIYSLIVKYDEQLVNLLNEETIDEEKIIQISDKILKLNAIIPYLLKKR